MSTEKQSFLGTRRSRTHRGGLILQPRCTPGRGNPNVQILRLLEAPEAEGLFAGINRGVTLGWKAVLNGPRSLPPSHPAENGKARFRLGGTDLLSQPRAARTEQPQGFAATSEC